MDDVDLMSKAEVEFYRYVGNLFLSGALTQKKAGTLTDSAQGGREAWIAGQLAEMGL